MDYFGHDINSFFFWKGRVALYAILQAIGIKPGDEIILPAFTCVVVPSAIKYLGARPVYTDIDPDTYNVDVKNIAGAISDNTAAVMAQNTFGLSSDLDPIIEIARKHGLAVIEDCAHGFGGTYRGRMNGTVSDAAFFSMQWNKAFSTGIGGIAVTKNGDIASRLGVICRDLINPSIKEQLSLKMQLMAKDYLLNNTTYWALLGLYRWLSEKNIITGSSQGYELERPDMPEDYFKGFSRVQRKRLEKGLGCLAENLAHRKKVASAYHQILESLAIGRPFEPDYAEHTFVKYPLLVHDRDRFMKAAEKARVEIGDWMISPLHPVTENLELWDYHYGENPIAEKVSMHMVNLHTHRDIDEKAVGSTEEFLRKNRDQLIPYNEIASF